MKSFFTVINSNFLAARNLCLAFHLMTKTRVFISEIVLVEIKHRNLSLNFMCNLEILKAAPHKLACVKKGCREFSPELLIVNSMRFVA